MCKLSFPLLLFVHFSAVVVPWLLLGLCVNSFGCFRFSWAILYFLTFFIAPSVSVVITPAGTAVAGQSYSLSCSVSGADSLSPTSTTYHWYNESSNPRSQVGTTSTYSFPRLRPYYAGQYTCEVTVASPYLNEDLSQSMMQDITLQSKLCNLA